MSDAMKQVEVLRAACCVAGIDGDAGEEELRLIQRLADKAGVGAASLQAMIDCAESDEKFYEDQFRVLKTDPKKTMQILFKVAIVDGELTKQEGLVLKRLSIRLDVPPEHFDGWLRQAVSYVKKKGNQA